MTKAEKLWLSLLESNRRGVAIATSAFLLSLLVIADALLGFQPAFRVLYVLPLWLATRLGGKVSGFAMVLLGALAGVAIDLHNSPLTSTVLIRSGILHVTVLGLVVIVINKIEEALWTARKQALHDPLTGLLNRRALADFGGEVFDRCQALNEPLTAVMIDCNDFKALNDEYGHQAGDHTLQLLARALETETRKMDIIARVGGDEFVMLLPGSDEAEAKKVMIRVEDAFIRRVCDAGYATSLSVGLASANDFDQHFNQLLGRADSRMYSMKAKTKSQAYLN